MRVLKRQKISREAFRTAILNSASDLFIERGFDGTNIGDIAASLGVTRSAIYYYFKSKQAILAKLTEDMTLLAGRQTTDASKTPAGEPDQQLSELVRRYATLILSNPQRFRVVERNEKNLPTQQQSYARTARRKVYENFSTVIERGIRTGHFQPVDPRLSAFFIIGMCAWSAWWFNETGRKSRAEVVDAIASFAIHALKSDHARLRGRGSAKEMLRRLHEDLSELERLLPQPSRD
jgi:AcrR family transcriptional regulator